MKRLPFATARPGLADSLLALALLILLLLLADPSRGQTDSPYGYLRTLEGTATLIAADSDEEPFAASINQPVLPGDRLVVDPGAQLEVVLPEGTRVRAGGGAELYFAILGSTEEDSGARVQIDDGELQLTVPNANAGSATPRIDTGNAAIYAVEPGHFSVSTRSLQHTLVNVRTGAVEVLTPRGSSYVRAGEALAVQGQDWPEVALVQPAAWSSLENWGRGLDERLADVQVPAELDGDLAYDAASLDGHGDWVDVEGQYAWRPAVRTDWQPYTAGHWYYTPAGLNWVSAEPWGWMTYHYGSWNLVSHYGWVWYPARQWAPAWVYWYWGPSHVGWAPVGIYTHHYWPRYGHHGSGFRWGSYGWAGGSWNHYRNWTFVSHDRLHERDLARHAHLRAADTRPHGVGSAVPRGLITTDTSALSRQAWKRPSEAAEVLSRGAVSTRPGAAPAVLPDVTSFVARSNDLAPDVERRVLTRDPGSSRTITAPSGGRQALRRVDAAQVVSGAPGRAVARTPDGRRYEAVDVTRGAGRPVSRGSTATGDTDSWRRTPTSRAPSVRVPEAGSIRSRSQPDESPSSRAPRRGVSAAPTERPVQIRPRTDSRTTESSSWRRQSSTRPVAPHTDAGRPTTGSPPVRRVIDAMRAAPTAPPIQRVAPPSRRASPPPVTTAPTRRTIAPSASPTPPPSRSAPSASPDRGVRRGSDSPPASRGRSSQGVSSRSSSERGSPSSARSSGSRSSSRDSGSRGRAASSRRPD